jgi:quercetin dioxygenase-like cupin family protein
MEPSHKDETSKSATAFVPAGQDKFGHHRGLGISVIQFKLTLPGNDDIFILENVFKGKGGPPRHVHPHQDEWFYALEGTFEFEIGTEKIKLGAGDSVTGPRGIPHVWASTGDTGGRILVAFSPAGKMEAFFAEVTKTNAMPTQDPALWLAHGMQVVGPPLPIA